MGKTIKLNAKQKPSYKYRLNEMVTYLIIGEVIDHLAKHDISRSEFYADRKIPFGSKTSIPADRLQKYAIIFDASISDLQNEKVKATSIHSLKAKKLKTALWSALLFILLCSCSNKIELYTYIKPGWGHGIANSKQCPTYYSTKPLKESYYFRIQKFNHVSDRKR